MNLRKKSLMSTQKKCILVLGLQTHFLWLLRHWFRINLKPNLKPIFAIEFSCIKKKYNFMNY